MEAENTCSPLKKLLKKPIVLFVDCDELKFLRLLYNWLLAFYFLLHFWQFLVFKFQYWYQQLIQKKTCSYIDFDTYWILKTSIQKICLILFSTLSYLILVTNQIMYQLIFFVELILIQFYFTWKLNWKSFFKRCLCNLFKPKLNLIQ